MYDDITNYLKTSMAEIVVITTASRPFERVFIDKVAPLQETHDQNKYILSFKEDLSKFMLCIAIREVSAESVARGFFEKIMSLWNTKHSAEKEPKGW